MNLDLIGAERPQFAFSVVFDSAASMRVIAENEREARRIASACARQISGRNAPKILSVERAPDLDPEEGE